MPLLMESPFTAHGNLLIPVLEYSADYRFACMPALTKKDIREHFPDVLPPGLDIAKGIESGQIELVQTSGTTDDKITNLWNQKWWDASEQSIVETQQLLDEIRHGRTSRGDTGQPEECRLCLRRRGPTHGKATPVRASCI